MKDSAGCALCPRMCGADRQQGAHGYCGAGSSVRIARAAPHYWEEPCISGTGGSGTVFFSGCQLKCCFCQNHRISHGFFGADITEERLSGIFLSLQERGVHNINLVSATPYTESVLRVLDRIRGRELTIPIVWNSGGYERVETLRRLEGYVDVYLPDLKFYDRTLAGNYAAAPDYFPVAWAAVGEMIRQTGSCVLDSDGIMHRGTIVRHLVLPGGRGDSMEILRRLREAYSPEQLKISLMSQYTPYVRNAEYPVLNRRITTFEYESVCRLVDELGFDGYFQEKSSAKEEYTPPFDLEGVLPDNSMGK